VALFILRLDRHPSLYDDRMNRTHLMIAKNISRRKKGKAHE